MKVGVDSGSEWSLAEHWELGVLEFVLSRLLTFSPYASFSLQERNSISLGSISPGGGPAGQILSPLQHGQMSLLHVIILTFELGPETLM